MNMEEVKQQNGSKLAMKNEEIESKEIPSSERETNESSPVKCLGFGTIAIHAGNYILH